VVYRNRDNALLVGCALRRAELAALTIEDIQQREGRWVIADMHGKGGRIRTVAVQATDQGGDRPQCRTTAPPGQQKRTHSRRGIGRLGGVERSRASGERDRHRTFRGPRSSSHMCENMPQERRRPRADQVPARTRLGPNHRALPRHRAEIAVAVNDNLGL
jgi:integrase